jgi:hypothetical protein
VIDEAKRTVAVTEEGIAKVEQLLDLDNLYEDVNTPLVHHLQNALKAKDLFKRDREYIVEDGEVHIVDENTGRVLKGRRYSEGLHQAIEAKEGVRIKEENQTLATVTLQNYYRTYDKLAGMTGTAKTEEMEFLEIYDLGVVQVPTNKPVIRDDRPDLIYKSEAAKFEAVAEAIEEANAKGQPVLVGTTSVEKSEHLSNLLRKRGVAHEVLNAKNHAREAHIVAEAGRLGAVTVSTNMAGRGTDIVLGGNPEEMARAEVAKRAPDADEDEQNEVFREAFERFEKENREEGAKVKELGGLYVVGTERHDSRRIDNQLRGRSGRQGDPGASRFFLSLEDDLMRLFNASAVDRIMTRLKIPEDVPIEHKWVTKAVANAQQQVESLNFDRRKNVLKYDDVLNEQRKVVYGQRQRLLEGDHDDVDELASKYVDDTIAGLMDEHCPPGVFPEEWDLEGLAVRAEQVYECGVDFAAIDLDEVDRDELFERLRDDAHAAYERRQEEVGGEEVMREIERRVVLSVVDRKWREHLYEMDALRDGIGLRAMGQRDPLTEYQREAYDSFVEMMTGVKEESVTYFFRLPVKPGGRGAGSGVLTGRPGRLDGRRAGRTTGRRRRAPPRRGDGDGQPADGDGDARELDRRADPARGAGVVGSADLPVRRRVGQLRGQAAPRTPPRPPTSRAAASSSVTTAPPCVACPPAPPTPPTTRSAATTPAPAAAGRSTRSATAPDRRRAAVRARPCGAARRRREVPRRLTGAVPPCVLAPAGLRAPARSATAPDRAAERVTLLADLREHLVEGVGRGPGARAARGAQRRQPGLGRRQLRGAPGAVVAFQPHRDRGRALALLHDDHRLARRCRGPGRGDPPHPCRLGRGVVADRGDLDRQAAHHRRGQVRCQLPQRPSARTDLQPRPCQQPGQAGGLGARMARGGVAEARWGVDVLAHRRSLLVHVLVGPALGPCSGRRRPARRVSGRSHTASCSCGVSGSPTRVSHHPSPVREAPSTSPSRTPAVASASLSSSRTSGSSSSTSGSGGVVVRSTSPSHQGAPAGRTGGPSATGTAIRRASDPRVALVLANEHHGEHADHRMVAVNLDALDHPVLEVEVVAGRDPLQLEAGPDVGQPRARHRECDGAHRIARCCRRDGGGHRLVVLRLVCSGCPASGSCSGGMWVGPRAPRPVRRGSAPAGARRARRERPAPRVRPDRPRPRRRAPARARPARAPSPAPEPRDGWLGAVAPRLRPPRPSPADPQAWHAPRHSPRWCGPAGGSRGRGPASRVSGHRQSPQ